MERRAYRIAKFGSWERSQDLDAQVAANGVKEGVAFAFDKMTRTPNTLDSHRLIWLAERFAVQDSVVEALFRGYFEEGLDLSDRATLVNIARDGGIPVADAERLLAGDEGQAEVYCEEDRYKSLGVNGVPTFFFNGTFAFSGAGAPEMLADGIRRAMG
jgi:predicted DsbA family dithiol-disulfide isomerase